MDNIKSAIDGNDSRQKDLKKRKASLCGETGRNLWEEESSRKALASLAELKPTLTALEELYRKREELQGTADELNRILEEKRQTEDARRENRNNIRELDKANQGLYENMGRAGYQYQAYREGLLTGEAYRDIFSGLEDQREKINTFEVELKKSDEERGGLTFFRKIAHRSREVYLKSNQSMRLRNLVKIYQKAGEALGELISGSEDLPGTSGAEESESLKRAFLPYRKNRQRRDTLLREETVLSEREQKLLARLEEMNLQKNPLRSLQEMEQTGFQLDQKALGLQQQLGELWWALDKKKRKEPELPEGLVREWEALVREEDLIQKEKVRLNRQLAVEELRLQLQNHEKEKLHLENRILRLNDELDREKAEIDRVSRELEALEKELISSGAAGKAAVDKPTAGKPAAGTGSAAPAKKAPAARKKPAAPAAGTGGSDEASGGSDSSAGSSAGTGLSGEDLSGAGSGK